VRNPDGGGHGVASLTVDGRTIDGNLLPQQAGPGPVTVEVVLGAPSGDKSAVRPLDRESRT